MLSRRMYGNGASEVAPPFIRFNNAERLGQISFSLLRSLFPRSQELKVSKYKKKKKLNTAFI